jgi:hypothetical protein
MKTLSGWVLACVLVLSTGHAEETVAPLPNTITMKSGHVFAVKEVLRWKKDAVVIKHPGGADPIRFDYMAESDRAIWAERAKLALPEQEKLSALKARKAQAEERERQASEEAEKERARLVKSAIERRVLIVGMTSAEATEAWGAPMKVNASGGKYGQHEQWIYYRQVPGRRLPAATYVYFEDGLLTSWQTESD